MWRKGAKDKCEKGRDLELRWNGGHIVPLYLLLLVSALDYRDIRLVPES